MNMRVHTESKDNFLDKSGRNSTFQVEINQISTPAWYVIHSLPNHEFVAEKILLKKELTVFLPRIQALSRRKDRKKIIEMPLFRGYLFIHTALWPKEFYDIMNTQGVYRILGVKGRFIPVPPEIIESIKIMLNSGRSFFPCDKLAVGARVRIAEGPLEGAVGVILRRRKKNRRLVVSVEFMNLAVAVELANEAVEPYS